MTKATATKVTYWVVAKQAQEMAQCCMALSQRQYGEAADLADRSFAGVPASQLTCARANQHCHDLVGELAYTVNIGAPDAYDTPS